MTRPSLLKGHPYTPSHATDIRKTIRREQKRLREIELARDAAQQAQQAQAPKAANVEPIPKRKRA